MNLEIVLEEEEEGTFSVHCPALKGCHSQGETREEALQKEYPRSDSSVESREEKKGLFSYGIMTISVEQNEECRE